MLIRHFLRHSNTKRKEILLHIPYSADPRVCKLQHVYHAQACLMKCLTDTLGGVAAIKRFETNLLRKKKYG